MAVLAASEVEIIELDLDENLLDVDSITSTIVREEGV
jgi:hypothetical protein